MFMIAKYLLGKHILLNNHTFPLVNSLVEILIR